MDTFDAFIATGALSLGLLIGGLVGLYVAGSARFDLKALTGAVSILGGAGVLAIFHILGNRADAAPREYWAYPIGLLAGAGFIGFTKLLSK
jgi:hypothetical protein